MDARVNPRIKSGGAHDEFCASIRTKPALEGSHHGVRGHGAGATPQDPPSRQRSGGSAGAAGGPALMAERAVPSVLGVRGLHKSFGAITALKDVSLDIAAGEVRAICGE